ncbi:MAG: hypothetical protein JWO53_715 [Chlamydiia bacterium]|nr:hypothetical protein [Chlamydiia bacterium]
MSCISRSAILKSDPNTKKVSQVEVAPIKNSALGVRSFLKGAARECSAMIAVIAPPMILSAVTSAFSYAMGDPSLSKIVAGVGYTVSGGYLIAKSSRFQSNQMKMNKEKDVKNTITRVTSTAVGAAVMVYGLATVASGVHELYQRIATGRPSPADEQFIKKLTESLKKCPQVKEQWEKVEEGGPFSIKLASKREVPADGSWNYVTREIELIRTVHDDSLSQQEKEGYQKTTLLFELCNGSELEKATKAQGIDQYSWIKGEISKSEYVKKMIKAEREAVLCHHKIAKACVKSQKWPHWFDMFKERLEGPWKTADSMYTSYLQNPSQKAHREALEDQWEIGMSEEYCRKHPRSSDCHT